MESGVESIPHLEKQPWRRFYSSFEWKEFVCGWGSAFINITLTYPIYKMIFRQILHGVKITSAYDQLRHEGVAYLYRGILPPMAQKTVSFSIMFGVYDGTLSLMENNLMHNPNVNRAVAGMVSGTCEAILVPFERIQTLLQDSKFHLHFKNTADAFRYVIVNHGFRELYRGISPVLLRNGPSNVLFFTMREEAKEMFSGQNYIKSKRAQEFISGALIGAFLSGLFYPFNVIKVGMQCDIGHKPEGILKVTKRIYRERGNSLRYFYRGWSINSSRAFISWGIINTAYEHIKCLIY